MVITKKDLEEKLGFNHEERKLIMDFQKKLPILTEDNEDSMRVNARELYEQLKVKSKFADWIKNRITKYDFVENKDYNLISKNLETRTGGTIVKEYNITLDMAKEISMIENNEIGKSARKYFILMEKAINKMIKWKKVREPEKDLYKQMCKELDMFLQRNYNKKAEFYDYTNEADAINLICLGAKAKQILAYFEAQDKKTRDHLLVDYNIYISKIQELNIMYLRMNMEKMKRYDLIKQGFKALYPNASYVIVTSKIAQ
jgi:phage anti-repressor protein